MTKENSRKSSIGQIRKNKPYQPAIGRDFDIQEVDAEDRGFLTKFIVIFAASSLAITGIYGLISGNYTPIISVWAIAGPIIGAVVLYYYGPKE